MAATYHFLEEPSQTSAPVDWFLGLPDPPVAVPRTDETVLFFKQHGDLVFDEEGQADGSQSPIVIIYPPRIRRGLLWTAGQVCFLTKRKSKPGPAMAKLQSSFRKWLDTFPVVGGHDSAGEIEFHHYLVGANWGFATRIVALPSGMEALLRGQFFVNYEDNDFVLDKVCGVLRLSGINCRPE